MSRIAIVTGANHGIGAATARALAAVGVEVLLTYLRLTDDPDPGIPGTYARNRAGDPSTMVAAIEAEGGRAVAVEADLADPEVPARLFAVAEAELGPVDILVNNASGWLADTFRPAEIDRLGRRLQPVTAASFDEQFAVDARAAALLIAEFAARLVARGGSWGRIVGLTSGGPSGFPEEVTYGAAKAALENYTMSAAQELASLGVTANIVYPPVTDTGWVTEELRRALESRGERVAEPEDVASVIAWLCSDAAAWVTGNVIKLR